MNKKNKTTTKMKQWSAFRDEKHEYYYTNTTISVYTNIFKEKSKKKKLKI